MKKLITLMFVLSVPLAANAQSSDGSYFNPDILKILIAVFCMGIAMLFILKIFKLFFDYQLKNKALELRVSEELAASLLNDKPENGEKTSIKWFFIFSGLGIGFAVVHFTLPLGYHSLAIIALSLAAAFLGYFSYSRFSRK